MIYLFMTWRELCVDQFYCFKQLHSIPLCGPPAVNWTVPLQMDTDSFQDFQWLWQQLGEYVARSYQKHRQIAFRKDVSQILAHTSSATLHIIFDRKNIYLFVFFLFPRLLVKFHIFSYWAFVYWTFLSFLGICLTHLVMDPKLVYMFPWTMLFFFRC